MSFWLGKRVLVTGASGLVGSWLVPELVRLRADVTCLIRDTDPQSELIRSRTVDNVSVVTGSLEDYNTCERALAAYDIDTIFHLGAQAIVRTASKAPMSTFESNIRGTYCLLEAARRVKGVERIVIASSDKAYGKGAKLPYTEDMPLVGRHPYDVSKSCTDLIAQSYFYTYDLPIAIARCGNIFGGGDLNFSRIFPSTIRSFHYKQSPIIRSNGCFTRDYIYVKDVVQAYLLLGSSLTSAGIVGEAFNFGPNSPMTVLDVVQSIACLMGCEDISPTILNQAEGEIVDQYLSSEKARKLLGWEMSSSYEEGVRETIMWYEKYLNTLHPLSFSGGK